MIDEISTVFVLHGIEFVLIIFVTPAFLSFFSASPISNA
jgi:hypothetical protein